MKIEQQIEDFIKNQPEQKRLDLEKLHHFILEILPKSKLWFLDGKNSEGQVISNPNIGYGIHVLKYSDGSTKEFYQIGISPNTSGISIYFMGLDHKNFLKKNFAEKIGKATVTGYCIKFRKLEDINLPILVDAIQSVAKSK